MEATFQRTASRWVLVSGLLLVMGAEYYFLRLEPTHSKWYGLSLSFFSKGGFFCRIVFVLLYPLCIAFPKPRMEGINSGSARKRSSSYLTLAWLSMFVLMAGLLLTIHRNPYFSLLYPITGLGVLISGYQVGRMLPKVHQHTLGFQNDTRKKENGYSFHFRGRDRSWVNIANPFRGILVIGGAGSGKSYSIAEPLIAQAARKGYAGIVYDFKFPTLTDFAFTQYAQAASELSFWVVNFEDMRRTHRVNPLHPRYLPSPAHASEYALAIINNLLPETIAKPDFWSRSAQALLTATIWYLRKHFPAHCSLPHVINLIVYENYHQLLKLLGEDYECASMIRSILTAVEMKASNQTAGMVSTLQLGLGRINTPEMGYVLSGDEFSLDINDPSDPKLLCIGTSPTLCDTFSPLISCLITVALKQMNQPGKHHSYVLLDEGPTLYIPKLDQLPATARSNKVATVYMAQDFSQMKSAYGQHQAEAIIANLNNQFFGRVANLHTAEYVSRLFGKQDKLMRSEGISDNHPRGISLEGKGGSVGSSVNYSLQERSLIQPQELLNLEVGHFLGTTVETDHATFSARFRETSFFKDCLPILASHTAPEINFERIRLETKAIIEAKIKPGVGEVDVLVQ